MFRRKNQGVCKGPEAERYLRVGGVKQASVLGIKREKRQWYQMRLEMGWSRDMSSRVLW